MAVDIVSKQYEQTYVYENTHWLHKNYLFKKSSSTNWISLFQNTETGC
jgi:hypothetical protein